LRVREFVLNGGEEYQLVFTGSFTEDELARLRAVTPVTEIGTVTTGAGVFLREAGSVSPLQAGGYSHQSQT
jgi:thiamine monophosphate kinase